MGATLPGDNNAKNPPAINYSGPQGFDTRTTQRAFGDGSGSGFGNWKGLDLWTYYPVEAVYNVLDVIPTPTKDLRLSKTHASDFTIGTAGGSFTLQVKNLGTDPVTGPITVTDVLPTGLSYNRVTGVGWSCTVDGQTVTCIHPNSGGLASGASLPPITLVVNVAPAAAPVVTNTATLENADDTNPANNTATDSVNVKATDLRLTKTASSVHLAPGEQVTFTITLENLGPVDATGVAVQEVLPSGLTLVSASATQGDYNVGTGIWTVGTLPYGTSVTLTVVAEAAGTGDLVNTASLLTAGPYELNSTNNSASAMVVVRPTVVRLTTLRATATSSAPWLALVLGLGLLLLRRRG